MSYSNPMNLFSKLVEQEKMNANRTQGSFEDSNILRLKPDTIYTLRLLWLPSEERKNPMIIRYVHKFWDNNAASNKQKVVICPTSQYDEGNEGFKTCPICSKTSEFYQQYKESASASAEELYKKFRRTLEGYVPVYVVKGPDDVKGTVKILQFGTTLKSFLDAKIFGIKKVNKQSNAEDEDHDDDDDDSMIGIEAFMFYNPDTKEVATEGYNLKITVGSKSIPINGRTVKMNDYDYEFSRKTSSIDSFGDEEVTADMFLKLNEKLGFDKKFFIKSDATLLKNFYNAYLDPSANVTAKHEDIEEESAPVEKKANVKMLKLEEESVAPKKSEAKHEEPKEEDDDDDIDLDELMKM